MLPARLLTVYPVGLHLQKPLCLLQFGYELLLVFVQIWSAPDVAWSVACCRAGRSQVKSWFEMPRASTATGKQLPIAWHRAAGRPPLKET